MYNNGKDEKGHNHMVEHMEKIDINKNQDIDRILAKGIKRYDETLRKLSKNCTDGKIYPQELKYIHDTMLELYDGVAGEKDPGMVGYVCEKPLANVFGHEKYASLFGKAAIIMFSLAREHFFFDANKRTAVMSSYTFLMKNDYELIVSNDTLYDTCISVATGNMNEDE